MCVFENPYLIFYGAEEILALEPVRAQEFLVLRMYKSGDEYNGKN